MQSIDDLLSGTNLHEGAETPPRTNGSGDAQERDDLRLELQFLADKVRSMEQSSLAGSASNSLWPTSLSGCSRTQVSEEMDGQQIGQCVGAHVADVSGSEEKVSPATVVPNSSQEVAAEQIGQCVGPNGSASQFCPHRMEERMLAVEESIKLLQKLTHETSYAHGSLANAIVESFKSPQEPDAVSNPPTRIHSTSSKWSRSGTGSRKNTASKPTPLRGTAHVISPHSNDIGYGSTTPAAFASSLSETVLKSPGSEVAQCGETGDIRV